MRIGLFIDTFNLGGAETMVLDIADVLKRAGHTPILLHFGNDYLTDYANREKLEHHLVPNHKDYKKTVRLPLFAAKTISFLKSLKLDCLHSHLFGSITGMAVPARLAGVRHVGTLHDVYTIEEAPNRIKLLKVAEWCGTHLIAVSSSMRAFYKQRGNFKDKNLSFVANFVPVFTSVDARASMRNALNLTDEDFAFVSVGRLVQLKRFDLVIQAVKKVKMLRPDSKLKVCIVGGGELKAELKDLLTATHTEKDIQLLGERNDVADILSAADAFVLASDTEGMSRSILEAMSAGLPIVATDVGGNSDLVKQGENGFLVPADNAEALAKKFIELETNPDLRKTFAEKSKTYSISTFGESEFLTRHVAIYKGE